MVGLTEELTEEQRGIPNKTDIHAAFTVHVDIQIYYNEKCSYFIPKVNFNSTSWSCRHPMHTDEV